MSKTILAQVSGFTPVIDAMIPEVGAMTALVFGKAWRYCQMADGVCKAAQERIADELGISRATVNAHFGKLCEAGYLKDLTPELVGLPHQYADTGKANLSISLTGSTTTCQNSLQPPVKNLDTKKEVKKVKTDIYTDPIAEKLSACKFPFNPNSRTIIQGWVDDFPGASGELVILRAIEAASARGARNLGYVDKIIIDWKANGVPPTREEQIQQAKQKGVINGQVQNYSRQPQPKVVEQSQPTDADRAVAAAIRARRAAVPEMPGAEVH